MAKRYKENNVQKMLYIFLITLALTIAIFLTIFVIYNKRLRANSRENIRSLANLEDVVPNNDLKETSYSDDKTIEEAKNIISNNQGNNIIKNENKISKVNKEVVTNVVENKVEEVKEDSKEKEETLEFVVPISGEIIKDFAEDSLIYSKTLEEWSTHPGIDIKADKTSIVVASEKGTVEKIINDPKYGLSVTINHGNGFKTVYSNLLTSEFVKENDVVEKGQTIGTVGETANFEIADDTHLHFEMYKDDKVVNPTIYLK